MTKFVRFSAALSAFLLSAAIVVAADAPVTVQEDQASWTLSNGIITAKIGRQTGDLSSLMYKGTEMFTDLSGHAGGYWSHDARSRKQIQRITIDPKTNGGERAEVSVKGIVVEGAALGSGPGGGFVSDIEIRYSLARGESGIYTYCQFEHQPEYPDATLGEARYCAKLADFMDWMLIDEHHNQLYPMEKERDGDNKYNYTTVQFEHRAFGWASTTKNVGLFIVNPTVEYLSGGPTKVEFECHRDTTRPVFAPSVLNYWRSSHYGGSSVDVAKGEHWAKVIGPFMIYCNTGTDPQAIWKDAIARADREAKKWPFDWVSGVDYPRHNERGAVSGQLVLTDPLMPGAKMSKVIVGLAHPDYHITVNREYALNSPVDINWQNDAKHYEFWVHGEDSGSFTIPDVRPGKYTLHAFADGVLGEYEKAEITVEAGKTIDLGKLTWQPVRRGKQIWEIGIANRTGAEYVKGDDYFHDGMAMVYARLFPNDVNYTIGKSDFRKDWFYLHTTHASDAAIAAANAAATQPGPRFGAAPATQPAPRLGAAPATQPGARRGAAGFARGPGGRGAGAAPPRPSPWTISFDLPNAPRGKATLRFGIATNNTPAIAMTVNGKPAGSLEQLPTESSIGRNGIRGIWFEREIPFDASMMKAGTNTLTLTVSTGGVIYDYLRLELDESAQPTAALQ